MTGVFVPWNSVPRSTRSLKVGWITDANGCDIWQGARGRDGYPIGTYNGHQCRITRVRYEREIGPIPEGMQLDHYVCDNGPGGCCNPFHCRPVTTRENTLRGNSVSSHNLAKTHCPRGHEYTPDNIAWSRGGTNRSCRACRTIRNKARFAK